MPCPNCDKTMQRVGPDEGWPRIWHCPSCGSLLTVTEGGQEYWSTPAAVVRMREVRELLVRLADVWQLAQDLAEAAFVSADRTVANPPKT